MIKFNQLAPRTFGKIAPCRIELTCRAPEPRQVSPGQSLGQRSEKEPRFIVIDNVARGPPILDAQQDISQIEIGVVHTLSVHGSNTLRHSAKRRGPDSLDRSTLQRPPEILRAAQFPRDQPAAIKGPHRSADAS